MIPHILIKTCNTAVATLTFFVGLLFEINKLVSAHVPKLYDYIVTFDDEVRLVWNARWSLVKILYFLNRVVGCALIVVDLYCEHRLLITSYCSD